MASYDLVNIGSGKCLLPDQAISWNDVEQATVRSRCIHLRAIIKLCSIYLSWVLFLTHLGRVTHICVSKRASIVSDNGLSPGRRQAILWTNAGILLIGTLGTNFSEILIEIDTFSFRKMHFKMSSGKWRPFCLGHNVLNMTNLIL